jgi:hypothetical protein
MEILMGIKFKLPRVVLLAAALGLSTVLPASADVTITPTMVVIEGRDRFAEVHLVNITDKENSYELNWRFFSMEEGTGSYKGSEGPTTSFDLSQNIVSSPRRVTLPPNSSQKLRLALRLKGEPPAPGDYRSHLEIKQAKDDTPYVDPQVPIDPQRPEVQAGVRVRVGFSIPVIYRVGESNVVASIDNVRLQYNEKLKTNEAAVTISRNDSPYGTMGAIYLYHGDKQVGELKNANIFPEIKSRTFNVKLEKSEIRGGSLRVVYQDWKPHNNKILADKTIAVGQ